MVEPLTIGALVVSTLAMAAEEALKGSIGEAAKDAYQALKSKLFQVAGDDVERLEHEPGSKGRQAVVAEKIDLQSDTAKAEIEELTRRLVTSLKSTRAVGLNIGRLEAAEVQLGNIKVGYNAEGVRVEHAAISGAFKTGDIEVASPKSGKTQR